MPSLLACQHCFGANTTLSQLDRTSVWSKLPEMHLTPEKLKRMMIVSDTAPHTLLFNRHACMRACVHACMRVRVCVCACTPP